jgi:DNA-binding transcriptional LysR family regulator
MDWGAVGFDWNRARAFLAAAEEGSFSAAARALEVAQPTVGRQIGALEKELGVTLFERVGHDLKLTAAGLGLIEHVRAMNEAATRIALTAAGQSLAVDGTVAIAASEAISAFLLPPIVHELRRDHSGIEIEIVASNDASDLRRREADIALRNFRPSDPELVARKVKVSHAWLYGTPAYLDAIGNPQTPEELSKRATIIAFDRSNLFADTLNPLGYALDKSNFAIRTENHLVQWELCKRGIGLCFMMEEVGEAEPAVVRALPDAAPPVSFPTWLTSHRELQTSRRIRVVFDALADALGSESA